MSVRGVICCLAGLLTAAEAPAQTAKEQADARAILERIVAFRTAHGHGQVPKMIDYLADRLKSGGVPQGDIAIIPSGETAAMIIRIPAAAKTAKRPILFSAHLDVVDARAQDWTTEPYKLAEREGTFFGRGVSDNKTGVTALVTTVLRLKAERFKPSRDLLFALIGDEETDKLTTRLVARHPWVKDAEFVINSDNGGGRLNAGGRPTLYFIEGAEKTHINVELTTKNKGGHGSLPREDNAINELARALVKVSEHRFPVRANELTRAQLLAFADSRKDELAAALRAFSADPDDAKAADRLAEEPEFLALTRTTCVATTVEGGHVTNALPEHAKANLNCRLFPGDTVEEVRDSIVGLIADPKVSVSVVGNPQISPASLPRKDVKQAIERALRAAGRNVPIVPSTATGGSDGKVYRAEGLPTFGSSGMFIGASTNEHGIDERLPVSAFYEGIQHFYLLAKELGR